MKSATLTQLTGVLAAAFMTAAIAAGEGVHTLKPGNPERQAILDAVRPTVEELTERERIVFVVDRLLVYQDWAWLLARPETPNQSHRYEDVSALVKRNEKPGKGWRLVRMLGIEAGEAGDPEMAAKRQWLDLKKEFPALPQLLIDAALAPDP